MSTFFPIKLLVAIMAQMGKPIIDEIKRAINETFRDKKIISYKSGSNELINSNDFDKSSNNFL